MTLTISTNNVELTPELRGAIEKKLSGKLAKDFKHYPPETILLNLHISRGSRWGFTVKCKLDIPGNNIYAKETHKELVYAITALADELSHRLRKQKEKSIN